MLCPSCDSALDEQRFEATYGGDIVLDICHACHGVWFDDKENLRLSAGSVLRLLRVTHERAAEQRLPLAEVMSCPRCGDRLAETQDMQRNTRFSYFRCPKGEGRFITFFQFLREKNIVRSLDAKQLAELRKHVRVIHCSNCGAPVDLEEGSACEHCRAAVSTIDPTKMEAVLKELQAVEQKRQSVDPALAVKLMMDKAKTDAFYAQLDLQSPRHVRARFRGWGLVEAGIDALLSLI